MDPDVFPNSIDGAERDGVFPKRAASVDAVDVGQLTSGWRSSARERAPIRATSQTASNWKTFWVAFPRPTFRPGIATQMTGVTCSSPGSSGT